MWALLSGPLLAAGPPPAEAQDAVPASPDREAGNVARAAKGLARRLSTHTTDHFIFFYSADHPAPAQTGQLLEHAHDFFYRAFEKAGFHLQPIRTRLTWVIFTQHGEFDDYAREADYMDMSWLNGYYSARTNRVAVVQAAGAVASPRCEAASPPAILELMFAGAPIPSGSGEALLSDGAVEMTKAAHEAAHQLAFNSGLQRRGVMYPLWVSEGIATHFEMAGAEMAGAPGVAFSRLQVLSETNAQRRLVPLRQFITVTRLPADDSALTSREVYAEAWALFRFLFEQHGHELAAYLAAVSDSPTGWRDELTLRREFVAAFGSVSNLEESWTRFLHSVIAPPRRPQEWSAAFTDITWLLRDGS